jgi:hypothetical protein
VPEIKHLTFDSFLLRESNKALVSEMLEAITEWQMYFYGTLKRFRFLSKLAKKLLKPYVKNDQSVCLDSLLMRIEKIYKRLRVGSNVLLKYIRYIRTERLAEIFRKYLLLQDNITDLVVEISEVSKWLFDKLVEVTHQG